MISTASPRWPCKSGAPLSERARPYGIAAIAVTRLYPFDVLWPEVEALAQQDLVSFAFTAAMSYVAPAGGRKPHYGTNPMAFAWPRAAHPPLVFDRASSTTARGEIRLHLRGGRPLPEG